MKLNYKDFISKYKGKLTEQQFLEKIILETQSCCNCTHKMHDDFTEMGVCEMGDYSEDGFECNFELNTRWFNEHD